MAEALETRSIELVENSNDLLAIVSHELRTPITVILGWVELLSQQLSDHAIIPQAVEVIKRNAQAQQSLIDELLDYSRIAANKFSLTSRPVSLRSIIKAAIEDLSPIAREKSIETEMDLGSSEDVILGDSLRLHQVFTNLFTNAIKFSDRGGKIKVKLETRHGYHNIVVSDRGEGISPKSIPFVFDRYLQAERRGRPDGLGLGLTIARHIIELHGGTIEASSRGKGYGAVFTLQLPTSLKDDSPSDGLARLPKLSPPTERRERRSLRRGQ
ncbi:MAG TPA: HAMP domain-containing sensor histidine kinase [Blastocatellia bacterium]|nr:HAMP domain-containing sensor histidine kinase [Blastocatellia bacterium]